MSELKFFFFGSPRIERDDAEIEIPRRKPLAILAYLARTDQSQRRDTLAALLWPESDQTSARAALRRELHTLNAALGHGWLRTSHDVVELGYSDSLWIDIEQFEKLMTAASHTVDQSAKVELLSKAAMLCQEEFLANFTVTACLEFGEWQRFEAERLRLQVATVLKTLSNLHREQNQFDAAITHARQWLALDDTHEPAHRTLMQLYVLAGQRSVALRQYEECKRILLQSFNSTPTDDTNQLYQSIYTRKLTSSSAALHPEINPNAKYHSESTRRSESIGHGSPTSDHQPPHNLPPQPTTFVGREADLVEIQKLLLNENECRLLTLLGPGGIGKTRLSLQIGQLIVDGDSAIPTRDHGSRAASAYPDGVFFIGLAAISDAEYVMRSVADAVGFNFQGNDESQIQLANFLVDKRALLIVDNFEHLLEGAELLSVLLDRALAITILVTSRVALNLPHEWLYPVGGLAPPAYDASPTAIEQNSAVQLFVQRARQADGNFALTAKNQEATAHICRLVDGMPLGLELAAAWVQMLSVAEIADEIATNLDILASDMRNIPERHRSLRAVFEQTWQRLDLEEQSTLCRLAVFRGAFSREAAAKVVDADLMVMASLVDKSLCRQQAGRYELHELLRQFAFEHLSEDVRPAVQSAHSRYFAELLDSQHKHVLTVAERDMLNTIDINFDNIVAAWNHLLDSIDDGSHAFSDLLESYAPLLAIYFERRSMFRDGQRTFENALQRVNSSNIDDETTAHICMQLQLALAPCALQLGHFRQIKETLSALLPLLRQPHNRHNLARAQTHLGVAHMRLGEYETATPCVMESLEIYDELGLRLEKTQAMIVLGLIYNRQERHEEARNYLDQVSEIYTETGYDMGLMRSLNNTGSTFAKKKEIPQAEVYYRKALDIAQDSGNTVWLGVISSNLGSCAQELGRHEESLTYYSDGVQYFRRVGNIRWITIALAESSFSRVILGKLEEAALALEESLCNVRDYQLVADGIVALSATAFLFSARGQFETAVTIATHASEDERIRSDARRYCEQVLEAGAQKLAKSDFDKAQFEGRSTPFAMMVNEALKDL